MNHPQISKDKSSYDYARTEITQEIGFALELMRDAKFITERTSVLEEPYTKYSLIKGENLLPRFEDWKGWIQSYLSHSNMEIWLSVIGYFFMVENSETALINFFSSCLFLSAE